MASPLQQRPLAAPPYKILNVQSMHRWNIAPQPEGKPKEEGEENATAATATTNPSSVVDNGGKTKPEEEQEAVQEEEDDEIEEVIDDETPQYPKVYLDNIYLYNIAILVLSVIYTLGYIGQLVALRILSHLIYHGYFRPDLAPGPFVDDRINYFAIILAISATRLPVVFSAIWMLRPTTKSIKRTINLVICVFYLIVDVLVLISLSIAWGLICNQSGFGYAPCQAMPLDQCSIYGASLPDRCMPPYPVPPSTPLQPTWAFYLLFGCVAGFILLEIALLIFNIFLDDEAREYKRHLVFYQTY